VGKLGVLARWKASQDGKRLPQVRFSLVKFAARPFRIAKLAQNRSHLKGIGSVCLRRRFQFLPEKPFRFGRRFHMLIGFTNGFEQLRPHGGVAREFMRNPRGATIQQIDRGQFLARDAIRVRILKQAIEEPSHFLGASTLNLSLVALSRGARREQAKTRRKSRREQHKRHARRHGKPVTANEFRHSVPARVLPRHDRKAVQVAAEILGELLRRVVPRAGFFADRLQNDVIEIVVKLWRRGLGFANSALERE
jgi:hypothetical protein